MFEFPHANVSLTRAEHALFRKIHFGGWGAQDLPATVARSYSNGQATTAECEIALADCLEKGWLQVIDQAALAAICDDVRAAGLIGPIYDLPGLGDVDFTRLGAAIWLNVHGPLETSTPPYGYQVELAVHVKSSHFFRTKAAALAQIRAIQSECDVRSISDLVEVGPWRAQWWRKFPSGYRIDVAARGHSGSPGLYHLADLEHSPSELQRLPHVLDGHNVMLPQWLLLAAMDCAHVKYSSRLPKIVADSASKQFGRAISEEECRTGLQDCIRLGWLLIVDLETADTIREVSERIDQVQALLQEEPAITTMDQEPWARTTIHFTPPGAALYRAISAEWLGPAWEDEIVVVSSQETYREEHRFCETEEKLQSALRWCKSGKEQVLVNKVVPIGPWCVQWWKRFPRGYRLELQFGDSSEPGSRACKPAGN